MSRTIRVLAVIGTRPDAIKMFPVIRELQQRSSRFETTVCSTGQHRQLIDQVFSDLGYRPDLDLFLMSAEGTMSDMAGRLVAAVGEVVTRVKPDLVLVQGDTITATGAALAAYYGGVAVAHVEAGLRTWDNGVPFPEEGNRRVISALASLHFAPTEHARENLLREGVPAGSIHITGNSGIDALRWALARLPAGDADEQACVLITTHRRENLPRLPELVAAVAAVASRHGEVRFVWPVHPNPDVRQQLASEALPANVEMVGPLPYLQFLRLLRSARFVATDSGGLQEEAAFLGKPVVVLKEKTSRVELLEQGIGRLVTYDRASISRAFDELLEQTARGLETKATDSFGDGRAARRIVDIIDQTFAAKE